MPVKDNQAQGQFGTAQRVAYMSTEVTEANVFVRRLDGVSGSERISSTAGLMRAGVPMVANCSSSILQAGL